MHSEEKTELHKNAEVTFFYCGNKKIYLTNLQQEDISV